MKRFPNGARVCFVGDSLVARNQYLPVIIDCYRQNFPDAGIRFTNCGVSGGTAQFAHDSFEDDVLPHEPTHVVVAFGVNDSGRTRLEKPRSLDRYNVLLERFEIYKKYLTALCEKVVACGAELILCTPAPYDEYTETPMPAMRGGNALLCEYANFVRALARERGYTLVDYHSMLTRALQIEEGPLYEADHVHPTLHGFYLMAKYFLAEQGLEALEEREIPAYFAKWRDKLFVYRSIHAAECMIIRDYFMPQEQKDELMRAYLAARKWSNPYFETIANRYLEFKSRDRELAREIDEIFERDILS
ncbi:MAG: SGNH/GDSL hydrolase family protein [Clostridia bacterium]|nr:SGNH/GDSL hydrolase family protein [Clostridia bacterium]